MILIDKIRIDGGTQIRVEPNQNSIDCYADLYSEGYEFPPVTVFFDGVDYWLADGFHRYFAAKKAGNTEIKESIVFGTKREAVLFSIGANGSHGLNRTNADKRNAVETLLADVEWSSWSDRQIAKAACVSVSFVSAIRRPEVKKRQHENRIVSASRKSECSPTTHDKEGCSPTTPDKQDFSDSDADHPEFDEESLMAEIAEDVDPEQLFVEAQNEINDLKKIIATNDHLSEIKSLKDQIQVLTSLKNGYLVSINDYKGQVKHWKIKYEKLLKEVKTSGLVEF